MDFEKICLNCLSEDPKQFLSYGPQILFCNQCYKKRLEVLKEYPDTDKEEHPLRRQHEKEFRTR